MTARRAFTLIELLVTIAALLDRLATKLLAGEFEPGEKIKVTAIGDELKF